MEDFDLFYQSFLDAAGTKIQLRVLRDADNLIDLSFEESSYGSSWPFLRYFDSVVTTISKDRAYEITDNAVKLAIIGNFLSMTYRNWTIPGYAGQEANTMPHSLLASITISAIERDYLKSEEY